MKLLKKDRQSLEHILRNLKRAQAYLMNDKTFVCSSILPDALSYYNKKGEGITPMNKQIGSEIALLHTAIYQLDYLLNAEKNEEIANLFS